MDKHCETEAKPGEGQHAPFAVYQLTCMKKEEQRATAQLSMMNRTLDHDPKPLLSGRRASNCEEKSRNFWLEMVLMGEV